MKQKQEGSAFGSYNGYYVQ